MRAEINETIQRLTGTSYKTSEQHKEIFSSRMKRNSDDTMKVASILLYHNVFSPPNSLRNIITGVTANKDVNADEADEVGRKIINDMKKSDKYTFKQVAQITSIGSSLNGITINGEKFKIDPSVLFQRFVTSAESIDLQKSEYLPFELSSFPPSIISTKLLYSLMQEKWVL